MNEIAEYRKLSEVDTEEADIISILDRVVSETKAPKILVTVQDLSRKLNISAERVGRLLKGFGFRPWRTAEGRGYTIEAKKLQILGRQYIPSIPQKTVTTDTSVTALVELPPWFD